jgi:hypothetical protein
MGLILLTNANAVKRNSAIQDNVDDKLIGPYIQKAQFTHIHQILGTDLYERILSDIKDDNLTVVYKALLDKFVVPCLIEWTVYEVMPFISLKLDNKSITKGNSEFSDAADLNDLKYLRQTVRDLANFYNQRLIDFLKANTNIFPEYLGNSTIDKLKPTNNRNLFGGIYTGDGRSSKCDFGVNLPK